MSSRSGQRPTVHQGEERTARPDRDGTRIQTVGIIGSGVMGRGIAAVNLRAGRRVRLSDADASAASAAVTELRLKCDATRIRPPHFLAEHALPQVSVASSEADFADADLIIEAVPEDFATKVRVLSQIEKSVRPDCIIASNSSSIPIEKLASACARQERFCGLHFCHPVSERHLVEVVGSESTAADTIARAVDYAVSLGMRPIVVRDRPGFLLNRLLVPYLNEALELLLEGVPVCLLDEAALEFGMPFGPLVHIDEFGIDVALAVGRTLFQAYPERIVPSKLLIAVYKAGRRGRKSSGGFFATPQDATRGVLDPVVQDLIRDWRRDSPDLSARQVMLRLFVPMFLEATRILDESSVEGTQVIDAALHDGLGMTSAFQGLFHWVQSIGPNALLDWLRPLESLGERFRPTRMLIDAAAGRRRLVE